MPTTIMWVLRRAAKFTRNRNLHMLISSASAAQSSRPSSCTKYTCGNYRKDQHITRGLSSQSNQELLQNDKVGIDIDNENDGELASEELMESNIAEDLIDSSDDSLHSSDTEMASLSTSSKAPLFKIIMEAPYGYVKVVLEKWVKGGNLLDRSEVSVTMLNLRNRRLYGKALELAEWLEATQCFQPVEYDYASHLDLVAKVHGLYKAEAYIDRVPESLRGEVIYRTFLSNCVSALNVKKAEEVFTKIQDLDLPITTFACDQLLLLYKRVNTKKVTSVLSIMEKQSIKPSIFTYRLLIDIKGCSHDISGMEQIVEKMKAEKMDPGLMIEALVVWYYILERLNEKATIALKKMEGDDIKENRDACELLLPLYGALNKAEEVERVWNVCEENPRFRECHAAIEAWGKVGNVEKAEEVFAKAFKLFEKVSSKFFDALLLVYANHKLLSKAEDLVKCMKESGFQVGPSTWDSLVKLYIEAGEVEKADSTLGAEASASKLRPLHSTYLILLEEYSKRGDIHNAEIIFVKLRRSGYRRRIELYRLLIEAYLKGNKPAYGIRQRMTADNVFVDQQLAKKLTALDELLIRTKGGESEELDIELSFLSSNRHGSSPGLHEG